jgi:hypothetical protein
MRFTYTAGERPLPGYTIQQGLGRGGFGEVYQGVSDAGKQVALKLVQRNLDVELRGVGQCLNLKHPNLLSVYDVKQGANGDQWIVMEYVAGETLDRAIARHPQGMPPDEVLNVLKGICTGVGYLHDHGIVHRDLKPGNTFREGDDVKVGDYGLSKFISASRRSGQTTSIGTVHYMAPEVVKGRYGKEVDLYAVGVMLYEMLAGRVPFDGESPGEILMKHLTSTPDLLVIPPAFRPVVARLLEKDPHRRYSSVQALLADLDGYLSRPAEEGVEPTWTPERCPAPPDRGPTAREAMAFALQLDESGRAETARARGAAEASWGWVCTVALLLGVGVGCLVGVAMYNLPNAGTFGQALAWAVGTGASVGGGVLLLVQFFRWAGKFADPDTVRKFHELAWTGPRRVPAAPGDPNSVRRSHEVASRSGLPHPRNDPRPRGVVLTALGKLTLALFIGAGVGCIVGGSVVVFAPNSQVHGLGMLLGWGVGMIVFAGTAYGWLFDNQEGPRRRKREARMPPKEPPISRSELPQETGPWQPESERVH